MSVGFYWFKDYEIILRDHPQYYYSSYEIYFNGGDSTSHSVGNIIKVQHLIEKYSGKRIPRINEEWIDSTDYDLCLIPPVEMATICDAILAEPGFEYSDMYDRIKWFRDLSAQGYYLAYDFE